MNVRNRIRLARIRRAYRTIETCEDQLSSLDFSERYRTRTDVENAAWKDASELRTRFISESLARIRQGFVSHNVPKAERKLWIRRLIKEDF